MTMRRLRILTWHVHGNYLWYLTAAKHDFFLPVAADGGDGYGGRGSTFPLGENVRDIPADEVPTANLTVSSTNPASTTSAIDTRSLTPPSGDCPACTLSTIRRWSIRPSNGTGSRKITACWCTSRLSTP